MLRASRLQVACLSLVVAACGGSGSSAEGTNDGSTDGSSTESGDEGEELLPCPETLEEIPRREFRVGSPVSPGEIISGPRYGTRGRLVTTTGGESWAFWLEQSVDENEDPPQLDLVGARYDATSDTFDAPVELDVGDRRVETFEVVALADGGLALFFEGGGPIFDAYLPECPPEGNSVISTWVSFYDPASGWSFPELAEEFEGLSIVVPGGNDYTEYRVGLQAADARGDELAYVFSVQSQAYYSVRREGDGWSDPVRWTEELDPNSLDQVNFVGVHAFAVTADGGQYLAYERQTVPQVGDPYQEFFLAWRSPTGDITTSQLTGQLKDIDIIVAGDQVFMVLADETNDVGSVSVVALDDGVQGEALLLDTDPPSIFDEPRALATAAHANGAAVVAWKFVDDSNNSQGVASVYDGQTWSTAVEFTGEYEEWPDDLAAAIDANAVAVIHDVSEDDGAFFSAYDPQSSTWSPLADSLAGETAATCDVTLSDGHLLFIGSKQAEVRVGSASN